MDTRRTLPSANAAASGLAASFPHRHRLPPRLPEPYGIGPVRAGLRRRDTITETVRLCFDLRGWPEPTTGSLCTSYNAAGAGTNTARTVRTSFSAVAQHVRAGLLNSFPASSFLSANSSPAGQRDATRFRLSARFARWRTPRPGSRKSCICASVQTILST